MYLSQKFEKEIADLLLIRLRHRMIHVERAREIARFVLETIPEEVTDEQMDVLIPQLDERFTELAEVVHDYLQSKDNQQKVQALTQTRELLSS